jgi:hypothetical protein
MSRTPFLAMLIPTSVFHQRMSEKERTMSLQEFCIVCGACCGLAVLRFGLPAAIMWLASKAANRLTHAA